MGYLVSAYFYNPNIYPDTEYQRRLEAERTLCKYLESDLVEAPYSPDEFFQAARGLELEPEKGKRCDKCFELRLRKTAEYAKQNGIKNRDLLLLPLDFIILGSAQRCLPKNRAVPRF